MGKCNKKMQHSRGVPYSITLSCQFQDKTIYETYCNYTKYNFIRIYNIVSRVYKHTISLYPSEYSETMSHIKKFVIKQIYPQ